MMMITTAFSKPFLVFFSFVVALSLSCLLALLNHILGVGCNLFDIDSLSYIK